MPPEHECTWVYIGGGDWERAIGDPECPEGSSCSQPPGPGDYLYQRKTTGCAVD